MANKFIEFCNANALSIKDAQEMVRQHFNTTAHVVCSFAKDVNKEREDWLNPQLERYTQMQKIHAKVMTDSLWDSLTPYEVILLESFVCTKEY